MLEPVINRVSGFGWTRWLFMLLGLVALYGAWKSKDLFLGIIGTYLVAKAWFNWGCAGGSCEIGSTNNKIKTDV